MSSGEATGRFTTYTTAQGLSSNVIEKAFEDREGTLWIGTGDAGITRMTRRIITTISERAGLKGKIFYPIHHGYHRLKLGASRAIVSERTERLQVRIHS